MGSLLIMRWVEYSLSLPALVPLRMTLPAIDKSRSIHVAQIPPPLQTQSAGYETGIGNWNSLRLYADLCESSLLPPRHGLDDEPRRVRVAPTTPVKSAPSSDLLMLDTDPTTEIPTGCTSVGGTVKLMMELPFLVTKYLPPVRSW
jgi:hypothetical protein